MAQPEYGSIHSKKKTRLSTAIRLARQVLLLIVVAVLLVKMIIERRSLAP